MSIFWDEERVRGMQHRIKEVDSRRTEDYIWTMQQISDIKQRLWPLEQNAGAAKEETVTNATPSCSAKERITELRLTALETGKPIDVMEIVREALTELRTNGQQRTSITNNVTLPYGSVYPDIKYYTTTGPGFDAAIALLDFALTQHDKKESE